jgi:hypothetical protein
MDERSVRQKWLCPQIRETLFTPAEVSLLKGPDISHYRRLFGARLSKQDIASKATAKVIVEIIWNTPKRLDRRKGKVCPPNRATTRVIETCLDDLRQDRELALRREVLHGVAIQVKAEARGSRQHDAVGWPTLRSDPRGVGLVVRR